MKVPPEQLILEHCMAGRLRMIARVATSLYDHALRPLNLRIGQLTLLVAICRSEPLSASELARRLQIEKSTISRDLERLMAAGWVTSEIGTDRRERLIRITKAGTELLDQALPRWQSAQEEMEKLLGDDGVRAVHQIVDSIT